MSTDHLAMTTHGTQLCMNCGAEGPVLFPLSVDAFCQDAKVFAEKHKDCHKLSVQNKAE